MEGQHINTSPSWAKRHPLRDGSLRYILFLVVAALAYLNYKGGKTQSAKPVGVATSSLSLTTSFQGLKEATHSFHSPLRA